jgi:signal transduction histidine kinase
MNRRLFWKIFISFWLTQTIFITYLGVRAHQLTRSQGPLWLKSAQKTLPLLADSAIAQYETGGGQALRAELDNRSDDRFAFWLLDSSGHDLSGKPVSRAVADLAQHEHDSTGTKVHDLGNSSVVLTDVVHKQGRPYIYAGVYQVTALLRPEGLLRLVLISTVLSCITCLLLAHYLTKPIVGLRSATRKLAGGDLDARAGKDLGARADEIADLVRDFDGMADRIRELVQSQERLLSDVSHELRSPLARIRVALALARRGEDAAQVSFHERMENEIARLDELIGRILTLARLESDQTHPRMNDLCINKIIEQVVSDASFEAARTGNTIQFEAECEVRVFANEELLRGAIENVVRNAIYYTNGTEPVQVRLTTESDCVVLKVLDRGPGVPESVIPNLFRPFYRVDDSRMSATGGTGLGLAIAQKALALHGGSISARNVVSGGLIVELRMPRASVQKEIDMPVSRPQRV